MLVTLHIKFKPPQWQPEQNELFVESVLVPRQVTVISSSQDGQIKNIPSVMVIFSQKR